jgi:hypothetical protein
MFDTKLARRFSHLSSLPVLGWARVDLFATLAGRHLSADYQQAADLALDATNTRSIGPNSNSRACI